MPVVKIIGGHGRVALSLAKELSKDQTYKVVSLYRNPGQRDDVAATGAIPQQFDIENASVTQFVQVLDGADVVVWAAGAGGKGGPPRTYKIDCDAAIRCMQATREIVGVLRFVMVSYLGSSKAPQLSREHPLYHYGQAKHQADQYLETVSGLKYTIVSPGTLSNGDATGCIDVGRDAEKHYLDRTMSRSISRKNVALIIKVLITDRNAFCATLDKEIECLDGVTPITEALYKLV